MRVTRVLVLSGAVVVLVAAVAATSCRVHTKASSDVRVGADYRVRAYEVRSPVRIAGEAARGRGPHPSQAEPAGTHHGYETWLVQGDRRVVRVRDDVVHPAAARDDGQFHAYLAATDRPLLRVVRVRDGRTVEYEVRGGRLSSGRAPTWSVSSSGTAA